MPPQKLVLHTVGGHHMIQGYLDEALARAEPLLARAHLLSCAVDDRRLVAICVGIKALWGSSPKCNQAGDDLDEAGFTHGGDVGLDERFVRGWQAEIGRRTCSCHGRRGLVCRASDSAPAVSRRSEYERGLGDRGPDCRRSGRGHSDTAPSAGVPSCRVAGSDRHLLHVGGAGTCTPSPMEQHAYDCPAQRPAISHFLQWVIGLALQM